MCQQNMVDLRKIYPEPLKNARLVLRGVKFRFLVALRNGNFLYRLLRHTYCCRPSSAGPGIARPGPPLRTIGWRCRQAPSGS